MWKNTNTKQLDYNNPVKVLVENVTVISHVHSVNK